MSTSNSTPQPSATKPRKLIISLRPADYTALQELAEEQYRTTALQAAYLIAKILREAGRAPALNGSPAGDASPAPVAHAQRILNRARRAGSDEAE